MNTDPLTGAVQRTELAPALAAACREALSTGLLLIDLDHFKSINDAFGHAAGDAVLHEFGVRARTILRGGDLLVRYGGDEFVVILPNASLAAAHEVAVRLRTYVCSRPFPGRPPLTVTLSIGCAVADEATGSLSLNELMARADAHLYQAKRQGHNCVVSSEETSPAGAPPVAAADAQGRLIERDGAFTEMLAWLDALSRGERGLLRVLGAPGVGLTRFLQVVASTARLRGYRVLALTGTPALGLRQYGVLAEALVDTGNDEELSDLQRLLALIQPIEATGFLVIVDRLGDVDAATWVLLRQLVAHPAVGRVGLVVGLNPGLAELGRLPDLPVRAEVRLQRFSRMALQVWLRGALHWEAPMELGAWLHEQTDGYPALLQEAVRQLAADWVLTRLPDGAGWQGSSFVQEYPLHEWLLQVRAREDQASSAVRPYGQLVGRSAEVRTLKRALAEHRLVVLTGHGGVGKTHLALQAAAELAPRFADGVIAVPLASATAVEFVASALVGALGLAVSWRQEPQAVALAYLTEREMLLVFDGVEMLPGMDALVHDLLAAPRVRMLLTTRDPTSVPADRTITLHGLRDESPIDRRDAGAAAVPPAATPQSETAVPHASSGEGRVGTAVSAIFLQASGLYAPDALPLEESPVAIGHIFHLVQGYPLAIRMLASWTAFFGYAHIAERLTQHVRDRSGTAPENAMESPMQAVFDFFWSLLSEHDRRCIGGLALFRGGFTAAAAFDVAEVTPFLLAGLLDRAFVRSVGTGRYYLHELLRQYAWASLQDDIEAPTQMARRHAAWCTRLAAESAVDMRGPDFRRWVERLEAELDNLRQGLAWSLDHLPLTALQAALDLTEFWLAGSHPTEGYRWIATALARAAARPDALPASLRVQTLGRLGRLARQFGDTEAARLHLTTALPLAGEDAGSDRELAYSLSTLANIESDVEAHEQAVEQARRALQHARRLGAPADIAITANLAVWPFIFAGVLEEATRVVVEGLQASTACGDHRSTANLTNANATIAYYDAARHDEAIALYRHVIDLYEGLRDWSGLLLAFNNLASVYVDDQHFELAAEAFADARRIGRRVRQHRMLPNVLSGSGIVASVRGDDAAAWGFWREALELALASNNTVIQEECTIGLAYVWARAGFAAPAALLMGMIGLQPAGKPWLLPSIERAGAVARSVLSTERWEAPLALGAGLNVSAVAHLLLSCTGPYHIPEILLSSSATAESAGAVILPPAAPRPLPHDP
jgi:diguanylate cyclase (GGDEF)-like protein